MLDTGTEQDAMARRKAADAALRRAGKIALARNKKLRVRGGELAEIAETQRNLEAKARGIRLENANGRGQL